MRNLSPVFFFQLNFKQNNIHKEVHPSSCCSTRKNNTMFGSLFGVDGSLFGVEMMSGLFYKINFKRLRENIRAREFYVAHCPTQIL